jgi:hypothetical protein
MDEETQKGVFLVFVIFLVLFFAYLAAQALQAGNMEKATIPFREGLTPIFALFL